MRLVCNNEGAALGREVPTTLAALKGRDNYYHPNGAAVRTIVADRTFRYAKVLCNRRVAITSTQTPMIPRGTSCVQRTSTPTPLRKIPRITTRK